MSDIIQVTFELNFKVKIWIYLIDKLVLETLWRHLFSNNEWY